MFQHTTNINQKTLSKFGDSIFWQYNFNPNINKKQNNYEKN